MSYTHIDNIFTPDGRPQPSAGGELRHFNCDGLVDDVDMFVFQDYWHEYTGPGPCTGSFVIRTQGDVDALAGCPVVEGNLIIRQSYANLDLTPLRSLTSVEGRMEITGNAALSLLDGLQNLTSIGGSLEIFLLLPAGRREIAKDRMEDAQVVHGAFEVGRCTP